MITPQRTIHPFLTDVSFAHSGALFSGLETKGRKMTCCLSVYSSTGMFGFGAQVDAWFRDALGNRIPTSQASSLLPNLQWAAIRQIDLLKEESHITLFDLQIENFVQSLRWFNAARSAGNRLTIIAGGIYNDAIPHDDLMVFDGSLQEHLQEIVTMLLLDEPGSMEAKKMLEIPSWGVTEVVPQVKKYLAASAIFGRNAHKRPLISEIVNAVDRLPCRSSFMEHDVIVGLKIPALDAKNVIDWCPKGEFSYSAYRTALYDIFSKFDHIADSDGNYRPMSTVKHFRGHDSLPRLSIVNAGV